MMIVHTEVDKVIDGAIVAITLKVMEGDTTIQQCSFDLLNQGLVVRPKSCECFITDKTKIRECFDLISNTIFTHGVEKVIFNHFTREK